MKAAKKPVHAGKGGKHHHHPTAAHAKKAAAKKVAVKKAAHPKHPKHKGAVAAAHHHQKKVKAKLASGAATGCYYDPDQLDSRDLRYISEATPGFVDLAPAMPSVWDQGDSGSCVAHGALAVYMHAGGDSLTSLNIYQAAGDGEVRSAVKVAASVGELKYLAVLASGLGTCLSAGLPVVFGLTVFESFGDEIAGFPEPHEEALGAHCLVAVGAGYGAEWVADGQFPDADPLTHYLKLRNCWGTDRHQGGHLLMPTAYVRRWGADFWTMRSS